MTKKEKQTETKPKKSKKDDESVKQLEEATAKIDSLEAQIQEAKDASLRAMAELENFKRRKEQEKEDFLKYSTEKVIVDLLPIADNFDRAISHAQGSDDASAKELLDGFSLINKQIHEFFTKQGVEKIEALNQKFDPNMHQAVSQESKEGVDPDIVVTVMQDGYTLNKKVIRPAMVAVSQ